jgi:hypothetical protein
MVSPVPPGGQNDGSVDISVRITADQQTINKTKAAINDFKKTVDASFAPDNAKLQQARRAYQEHIESVKRARTETAGAADITDRWVRKVRELERAKALDTLSNALAKATKDGEKFEKVLADVNAQLRQMGASDDEISGVLGAAGNRASIGGRRGAALQEFGREARLSIPAFQIPGSPVGTEFLFRFAEVAGRLNLNFKDLAISGGALSIAIIGISLAFDHFQKTIAPIQKQLEGIIAARQEVAGLLAQNDPQAVVNRRDQAQNELLRLEGERTQAIQDQARIAAELLGKNQSPDALRAIFGAPLEALFDVAAKGPLEKVAADVTRLNAEYAAQQTVLNELNKEYEKATIQAKIIDLQKEYTDQLQRSGPVFEQLQQQYQDTIDSFNEANRQRAEDKRIADAFEVEDEALQDAARAAQHQDNLTKIEDDGAARIEKAREGMLDRIADLETKRDDKIADIAKNRDESIAKIRDDAREDETKAEEDYQKERERRLKEQAQSLLDAELSNDVGAFIKAQQLAEKENKEAEEDHQDEQSRRREASDDRIAELRAEADERTRVAIEQFGKEKAALEAKTQETIIEELAAIDLRKQAAIAAYNEETDALIAARERADIREAILEGVQENRRNAAHQNALAQIEQRRIAENALFTDILIALNKARNELASVNGQTYTPLTAPVRTTPGGPTRTAFADGGLITKPTVALMGERAGYGEALIPFRKSEGIEAALAKLNGNGSGGGDVHVHIAGIAPGVTQDDLVRVRREVTQGVAMGIHALRTGKVPA